MSHFENAVRRLRTCLRRGDRRVVLARMAARYATHGWDVIPGSFLRGERFDCGRQGCYTVACHPAIDNWETRASHNPATVGEWWRHRPYAVLLATGHAFDVLEVPEKLGRPVVDTLPATAIGGPVATAPQDRWMFLVRPGFGLAEELARRADVVFHSRGSWIPAPPTQAPSGAVRWRLHPRSVDYRMGDPMLIQSLIIAAMPQIPRRPSIKPAKLRI